MNRSVSYLTFFINNREFALPAGEIQTICDVSSTKDVESEVDFMNAVALNDSGVFPVVDLGKVLGVSDYSPSDSSSVILTNFKFSGKIFKIGLLVDMVSSVLSINKELVADSMTANSDHIPDEVEAVVTENSQKIYLLNAESLFSEDDYLDLFIEIKRFLGMQMG